LQDDAFDPDALQAMSTRPGGGVSGAYDVLWSRAG
jgi:hypothetical protein